MFECRDVRAHAGAWIDGELPAADASALDAHAASCRACAAIVAEQRLTRALVAAHATELRGVAPPRLRERVGQCVRSCAAGHAGARQGARSAIRRWAVAAALVLAVGALAAGAGGRRMFAAQLALDHYKCLLFDNGRRGAQADVLEAEWKAARGWEVDVPPPDPALGLTLVGLRRCLSGQGQMAHVRYEVGGRPVSLFIVPAAVDGATARQPIMGVEARSWTQAGRTYTLVGTTAATSRDLAAYMHAHAR